MMREVYPLDKSAKASKIFRIKINKNPVKSSVFIKLEDSDLEGRTTDIK
jgi:hypothetical protein